MIIPKKFSHSCKGSRPHIRLPNLGIWQRDWKSPGKLTLKYSRIQCQNFHRTRRNTFKKGTHKTLYTPGLRGKYQWPHKRLNQLCLWVCLKVLCGSVCQQCVSFKLDLNKILYDYTEEVTNKFKELDLIEYPKNYGWRFAHCTGGGDQNHHKEK